jgi:hypothetical protein
MSFVLPGNARSLRFSGEIDVEGEPMSERAPASLGKPRSRKPAPPSSIPVAGGRHRSRLRTPASSRDILVDPYAYGSPQSAPLVRHKSDDDDDGDPTTAMEREREREPISSAPPSSWGAPPRFPRPGRLPMTDHADPMTVARPSGEVAFASSAQDVRPVAHPMHAMQAAPAPSGAPYIVWILAAVLAGILSYHVAPEIAARFDGSRDSSGIATP